MDRTYNRIDRDLCAQCGNHFPMKQRCDNCRDDASVLRETVTILRRRAKQQRLGLRIVIRTLEICADRFEKANR